MNLLGIEGNLFVDETSSNDSVTEHVRQAYNRHVNKWKAFGCNTSREIRIFNENYIVQFGGGKRYWY